MGKLNIPVGKCGFTGQPGINATVNYINDSLELFELFVTDELVDHVKETNRYGAQQLANKILFKLSRLRKRKDTSTQEINILVATILLQRIIWIPERSPEKLNKIRKLVT
jgi:hypothetical protein